MKGDFTRNTFKKEMLYSSVAAAADVVRATALSGLQKLRVSRANYAQREQMRLAAMFGADHPEVLRLKAEVASDQRFGSVLGAEIDRLTTAIPIVDEHGWALHGFVRDQELRGQPDLTVALFDRTNRWIEAFGHVCTDARGYFQLSHSAEGSNEVIKWRELFIHVSNGKQEVLHRDKKPMLAVLGETKYREVNLAGGSKCCPPAVGAQAAKPSGERGFRPAQRLAKRDRPNGGRSQTKKKLRSGD
jgi:hypothetical protein